MNRIFPDCIRHRPIIALPYPNATGFLVQGPHEQVVFMEFAQDTIVPEHAHASQWEHVVAGRVDLTMHGHTMTYTSGDSFYIPADTPHAATVHRGYRAVIFFDQKDRYHIQDR
jgi:quercetin dioxygenase-like cupin family protein